LIGEEAQHRTLVAGWWGIWSLLANPIYLILNMLALRKIRALPEPAYVDLPRPNVRIVGATMASSVVSLAPKPLVPALP
jgi:hypothetical protein